MAFFMQSIILCALFTWAVPIGLMKNPINGIMSYPKAIRKRVEGLPQYQNSIQKTEKKHIVKKIIAVFVLIASFAGIAWFSGSRTFQTAFLYGFGLFTVINLWDLIAVDWFWFCHSKKVRLPGTEDMEKEYKDYGFHALGFLKGCIIGLAVSVLSAGSVALMA